MKFPYEKTERTLIPLSEKVFWEEDEYLSYTNSNLAKNEREIE